MDLALSTAERKLLVQTLERTLADLRVDVRSRDPTVREALPDEEKLVIGLLERLKRAD